MGARPRSEVIVNRLYALATRSALDRWIGSLHAGAIVRSLYLQWTLYPFLKETQGKILDAGCGSMASFARVLARRFPERHFIGLDLKLATSQSCPSNLDLCIGDLRALPVAGPFDVIYCVDVLEHLEDAETCISNLARCLNSGGYIFIHVPSQHRRHLLPGVELEYTWLGPGQPGDAHIWDGFKPQELETWLQRAGCQVLLSRFTFGTMTTILKEFFTLGEARRIPGVGLALLPFVVLAAWLEQYIGGSRGNGVLILAKKLADSGKD